MNPNNPTIQHSSPAAPCNNVTMQPCNHSLPSPQPSIQQSHNPITHPVSAAPALHHSITASLPFMLPEPSAWPDPVDLNALLKRLVDLLKRFVILPIWKQKPSRSGLCILMPFICVMSLLTSVSNRPKNDA